MDIFQGFAFHQLNTVTQLPDLTGMFCSLLRALV